MTKHRGCCINRLATRLCLAACESISSRIWNICSLAATVDHPHYIDLCTENHDIIYWQQWLVNLQRRLTLLANAEQPQTTQAVSVDAVDNLQVGAADLTIDVDIRHFETVYPKWPWNISANLFTWKASFVTNPKDKLPAGLLLDNWVALTKFLCSLAWYQCPDGATSFLDLAYNARFSGVVLVNMDSTPKNYACQIRKVINFALNRAVCKSPITPGSIAVTCLSNGTTHPSGFVRGAFAFPCCVGAKRLAIDCL